MPLMLRIALAQLRHRAGRTAALVLGILVATTSFTVLTGAARTDRLELHGRAAQNFRSPYDLLVRPGTSYTPLETDRGLVRPNHQSGIFGGITMAQYEQIRGLPGVEVAAPVATIGYLVIRRDLVVPLKGLLTTQRQQLFRIRPRWTTDRGTSTFTGAPLYVFVSRDPATTIRKGYSRGSLTFLPALQAAESVPGRPRPVPVCGNYAFDQAQYLENNPEARNPFGYRSPYSPNFARMSCYFSSLSGAPKSGEYVDGREIGAPVVRISVPIPVLFAAVDPIAESRLFGLDRSLTSGRLPGATEPAGTGVTGRVVPAIAASRTGVDASVEASVERVRPPTGRTFTDLLGTDRGSVERIAALPGTPAGRHPPTAVSTLYEQALSDIRAGMYWTTDASRYRQTGPSALTVEPVPTDPVELSSAAEPDSAPVGSDDTGVRAVRGHTADNSNSVAPTIRVVGRFDPARVTAPAAESGLTTETYDSAALGGATAADRAVLGDRPLLAAPNLAGYAAQPPALLTSLSAMGPMIDPAVFPSARSADPLSVIRVRVAGVTGPDDVSTERLNQVALAIRQRTGLSVDIVDGASAAPQTVTLPQGSHGRPELRLTENWARKGVAYTVVRSADRKSVLLFGLVLLVCSLVVGNAATASVRTRRSDLGLLSCLGWPAYRLFAVVLAELAVAGSVAGLAGVALALPLARAAGAPLTAGRAVVAVLAAVVLAMLAGLAPAIRASRSRPLDAVRPLVANPRRAPRVRGIGSLAVAGIRRAPGRSALAVVALATGVAGSVLGDAVAIQVRTADLVAVLTVVALGLLGIADNGYLSVRERASEFAVLRAVGWTDTTLARLVVCEALILGICGALLGALVAGMAVTALAGGPAPVATPLLLAASTGPVVAVVASVVPVVVLRRLPTARLLAED